MIFLILAYTARERNPDIMIYIKLEKLIFTRDEDQKYRLKKGEKSYL